MGKRAKELAKHVNRSLRKEMPAKQGRCAFCPLLGVCKVCGRRIRRLA